jgi:formylglycine-generating enzyme required for sulfatase activity
MDPTEVTVSAYQACVTAGLCSPANTQEYWPGGISRADECNMNFSGRENDPINCVSYVQATQYCAYVHKRLPTEQEWEWAARNATYATIFPWGSTVPQDTPAGVSYACWDFNSGGQTCPVESYPQGKGTYYPVYDLAGNVWEFTMSTSTVGQYTVRGGGFWDSTATDFYATATNKPGEISSGVQIEDTGFRCVASLNSPFRPPL